MGPKEKRGREFVFILYPYANRPTNPQKVRQINNQFINMLILADKTD